MYTNNYKYLTNNEAAEYLRMSPRTLEGYRVRGGGPAFCKVGRRVVYVLQDLDAWVQGNRHESTSEISEHAA